MAFAFLDASDIVIAMSTMDRDISLAPGATTKITGAPDELRPINHYASPVYHQRTSGNGTAIEDYAVLENVEPTRKRRYREIDTKTRELIQAGFEHPAVSGQFFSLSAEAQRYYLLLDSTRSEAGVAPVTIDFIDNSGSLALTLATDIRSFFIAAAAGVQTHQASGTVLKALVRVATTIADVEAIVDSR